MLDRRPAKGVTMNKRMRYVLFMAGIASLLLLAGCQSTNHGFEYYTEASYQYVADLTRGEVSSSIYMTLWKEEVTRHGVTMVWEELDESYPLEDCTVLFKDEILSAGPYPGTYQKAELESLPDAGSAFFIQVKEAIGDSSYVRMEWPDVSGDWMDIPDRLSVGAIMNYTPPEEPEGIMVEVLRRGFGEDIYLGDGRDYQVPESMAGQVLIIQVSYQDVKTKTYRATSQTVDFNYVWRKEIQVLE